MNTPNQITGNVSSTTARVRGMTYKGITTGFLFLLMSFVASSQDNNIVVREVEPFSAIQAGGLFDLHLINDDQFWIELEGPQELLNLVETTVTDGALTFSMDRAMASTRITARIYLPALDEIRLSGAVSLISNDDIKSPRMNFVLSGASRLVMTLNADSVSTRASGASNITLKGNAQFHTINLSGASQLKADRMVTDTLLINISGAAIARVSAIEMLDIHGSGTSRVTYPDEPENFTVNLTGTATANDHKAQMADHEGGFRDSLRVALGGYEIWILEQEEREKAAPEKSFKSSWTGFELGVNGYLSPENSINIGDENSHLELMYVRSIAVNINLWQKSFPIADNKLGLVTGLGLGFNNYRFDHQYRLIPHRDGIIPELHEEGNISKSKLTLTYLNVPFLLEFQTHGKMWFENFRLAGGMIVGTRIGTHAKYVFDNDGFKDKLKTRDDFNIQPFRFDVTCRIGWGNQYFFVTYSLNTLFRENRGPALHPFSVGVQFVRF